MDLERRVHKSHKPNRTLRLLTITFAAILGVSVIMRLLGGDPTGFVIAPSNRVEIGEMAYKGSAYFISSDEELPVTSAKLSGTVIGEGKVKVYLANSEERKLIFSNRREGSLPLITGFAVSEVEGEDFEGFYLGASIDGVAIEGENDNILSGIALQNIGMENGVNVDVIRVSWTNDGFIEEVELNELPFWDKNGIGSPEGKQFSGTTLSGWGQKLFEGSNVPLVLSFDENIEEKEITIEVFFNEYLGGFRLGDQRSLKIFLDLSGSKNSFVEVDKQFKKSYVINNIESSGVPRRRIVPRVEGDEAERERQGNVITANAVTNVEGEVPGNFEPLDAEAPEEENEIDEIEAELINEGKIVRDKEIAGENIDFVEERSSGIGIRIVEDPRYREIFESTPKSEDDYNEVASECEDTCVIDLIKENEYAIVFEIDEGTAIEVESIEFS